MGGGWLFSRSLRLIMIMNLKWRVHPGSSCQGDKHLKQLVQIPGATMEGRQGGQGGK